MQFCFHEDQSHFHQNGFRLRLALKQRHKRTRKWPISCDSLSLVFPRFSGVSYMYLLRDVIGSLDKLCSFVIG